MYETNQMMGIYSNHPRARAISYVYLLVSGLSRYHTCSSFFLTYSKSAHHTSNRLFGHRQIIQHIHQRHSTKTTTNLYNSKLLDETKNINIESAKKWTFVLAKNNAANHDQTLVDTDARIRNILVCGDGDLSYSAEISTELDALGIELYATVLEDEETHNKGMFAPVHFAFPICFFFSSLLCFFLRSVYKYSSLNAKIINAFTQHKVLFGVDATTLLTYFGGSNNATTFDRIQFNFPHWRGKANNRYNRQLLSEFLRSAATVLSPRGEIHIALCDGQGGCSSTTLQDWKGSWQASMFAAEHGLLLADVSPYEPQYNLSSHRGVDRPFNLGKNPKMHVFAKPNGVHVRKDIQLCCRHELHIVVPEDQPDEDNHGIIICSMDQILAGDAIEMIIQGIVPDGVRVEVPARQILEISEADGSLQKVAVFLIVYCSERYPVTRLQADGWRELAEVEVEKYVPLRENRRGRTVSHPFPYPSLHPEIKYRTTGER